MARIRKIEQNAFYPGPLERQRIGQAARFHAAQGRFIHLQVPCVVRQPTLHHPRRDHRITAAAREFHSTEIRFARFPEMDVLLVDDLNSADDILTDNHDVFFVELRHPVGPGPDGQSIGRCLQGVRTNV